MRAFSRMKLDAVFGKYGSIRWTVSSAVVVSAMCLSVGQS